MPTQEALAVQNKKWCDFHAADFSPWDSGRPCTQLVSLLEAPPTPIHRAIELGCGSGASVHWLATQIDVAIGVDLVRAAVDAANAHSTHTGSTATFVCADVFDLPSHLLQEPFDLVFDCQCFHCTYFVDADAAVASISALLKPGGLLLCLTGNDNEPEVGPAVLSRKQITDAFELSGKFDILSLKEGRFDPTPAYKKLSKLPLCWELLARRKGD